MRKCVGCESCRSIFALCVYVGGLECLLFDLHQKKSSGHNAGPQQLGFAWFPGLVVGEGLEVPPAVSCFGSVET